VASITQGRPAPSLARRLGPLEIAGPVGLAAGLDKDGVAIPFWPSLGFGFVEVGTVTAHPQPGNPRPRMFRFPRQGAIINRMGFNNAGSEALARRLRRLRDAGRWPTVPVGANVGKSKVTPLDEAPQDYATSVKRLRGLVDWFTVNVSSPNTAGLRSLQDREALSALLPDVIDAADGAPVFLKLAPDLTDHAIHDAVGLAGELGVTGIIATNTTVGRDGFDTTVPHGGESGGLSGRPLRPLALDRIRVVLAAAADLPVIGVGGVHRPEHARALLGAGCRAVQLYSGLIFDGPGLPSRLNRALQESA
jgi:dihydroorotate dehydrogenase